MLGSSIINMKCISVLFLILINEIARLAHGTCVLESDFGFILNCNFRKSGLFRVRNLGGVKAHFGLGFSVGDELGFPESIGNLEGGKRRALNYKTGALPNNIGVLPASKLPPVPPAAPPIAPLQSPAVPSSPPSSLSAVQRSIPIALTPRPKSLQSPKRHPINRTVPKSPLPSSSSSLPSLPSAATMMTYNKRSSPPLMTEAASLPLGVPVFKPIPSKSKTPMASGQIMVQSNTSNVAVNNRILATVPQQQMSGLMSSTPKYAQTMHIRDQSHKHSLPIKSISQNLISDSVIPPFQKMPSSVSRISNDNTFEIDTNRNDDFQMIIPDDLPKVDLMGHTVEELAAAANVSVQAIRQAIYMRQQQLLAEYRANQIRNELMRRATTTPRPTTSSSTTTTTTTTTVRPTKRQTMKANNNGNKVMNAPKEYYPVGYDKNFDDNFTTKVDLPPTTFSCGDQKHFPGLYADVDLGCMVFHVCALTDDGLIMKSFLCPESTLFDQTILKCNWWFYVDCKTSKTLYDSNIPISKSYQLMKSLTYFSNYNKQNSNGENNLNIDIEALKNTVAASNINEDNDNKKQDDWEAVVNKSIKDREARNTESNKSSQNETKSNDELTVDESQIHLNIMNLTEKGSNMIENKSRISNNLSSSSTRSTTRTSKRIEDNNSNRQRSTRNFRMTTTRQSNQKTERNNFRIQPRNQHSTDFMKNNNRTSSSNVMTTNQKENRTNNEVHTENLKQNETLHMINNEIRRIPSNSSTTSSLSSSTADKLITAEFNNITKSIDDNENNSELVLNHKSSEQILDSSKHKDNLTNSTNLT